MSREDRRRAKVGNRTVLMQRHPTQHPDHTPPVRRGATPVVEDTGPMGRAIVARGRVVHAAVRGEYDLVGYDSTTAAPVRAPRTRIYLPGETVELPVSEIERLRALGFLADPDFVHPSGPPATFDHTVQKTPIEPEPPAAV